MRWTHWPKPPSWVGLIIKKFVKHINYQKGTASLLNQDVYFKGFGVYIYSSLLKFKFKFSQFFIWRILQKFYTTKSYNNVWYQLLSWQFSIPTVRNFIFINNTYYLCTIFIDGINPKNTKYSCCIYCEFMPLIIYTILKFSWTARRTHKVTYINCIYILYTYCVRTYTK